MLKNIRIRTTPNGEDNYLKVKLEQDFDFLEVLSLKISQEETYKNFCSDYGVVIGRVTVSSGFGVPNAKVSIFVPISDNDVLEPELNGFYPYEVITDKNIDGIRYNLFPKTSETDNECFTPIGTFPTKREVLDNEIMTEIYSKYYKFTTTTNHAGDFMIFGVPVGTYVLHIDADMSDVGIISQRPYDSISQGTPTKFFESPTKYKGGTNLDSLVQVKSVNIGINVQPFWGSQENCEIGITRIDTDLNYTIIPSAIFMGSLFGDSDKHSVNKNCRPRKALGELCEQVAGEGTIEMIRETIDGQIEAFDVEGGRVIDKDGSWAYQIPMNLDYMITDEFGNLVLSDNPNVGLPTRANVRFRIGMDETGGTGRLRTRAKHLVPHNPTKGRQDEIDYEFGVNTKPTSFRTLYWNKIYTVNNFISRFQTNNNVETRAITGIKDVDSCVGTKNPFPFNKVNTGLSPIFFIICLLIKIIGSVVWIFNKLIVAGINSLLKAWNKLMGAFCSVSRKKILKVRIFGFLGFTCNLIIKYIECIGMKCPFDGDGAVYAPGCKKDSEGFEAMTEQPIYYPGDGCHSSSKFLDLAGLDDCVSAVMAEELNIFQFDFYNDWVNGSLYNFLIKYKRRKNTNGKFCEYECDSFASSTNDCHSNYLVDICYDGGSDSEDKSYNSGAIREGLIKKVGDEFYYAASTHNAAFKMFATDIVSLGSVFNCDWQGIPKIQQYLIPTTYKIPPIVQELLDGSSEVETTGQFDTSGCSVNGNKNGLFFDINCLGVHSNYANCLNIRHLCEFGVELDEYRFSSDGTPISCDRLISVTDIDTDDNGGKRVRDVFYGLNKTKNNFEMNFPYTTNFSTSIPALPTYDFTSYANNGVDYIDFRGYNINSQNTFSQPNNSFFFYFGLTPNNTGLDKMNQRFFTKCVPVVEKEFLITVKTTPTSRNTTADGTMTFNFVNGTAPFTYSISGQGGYNNQGTSDGSEITITNLAVGQYQITGIDDLESTVIQNFTISGPPRLFAEASVSKNATTNVASDGEITISQIGGGTGTYFYQLLDNLGGTVRPITNLINTPTTITNLPINILTDGQNPPNYGYKLVVTDSDSNDYTILNLPISGPVVLNAAVTKTDVTCFDGFNGVIRMNITGGQVPYTTTTTGPIFDGVPYESTDKDMFNLKKGTYVTTIIDSQSHSLVVTTNITPITGELKIIKPSSSDLLDGQDSTGSTYSVAINVVAGGVSGQQVKIKYNLDDAMDDDGEMIWITITQLFVDATTPVRFDVPKSLLTELITIKIVNSADTCESDEIEIEAREMIV
jgi:hypothetical protein